MVLRPHEHRYLKDCLPNAPSLNVGPHGYGGACKEDKKSLDGIYLSVAGGIPAAEAEVVCDALFDHGTVPATLPHASGGDTARRGVGVGWRGGDGAPVECLVVTTVGTGLLATPETDV